MRCWPSEEAQGIFPTGGWGWFWVGDPDRGYGNQQPGGWIYNILPNTELAALHDLGHTAVMPLQATVLQLVSTPLPFTSCPTRRRPALFPMNWGSNVIAYNVPGAIHHAARRLQGGKDRLRGQLRRRRMDQSMDGPAAGADAHDRSTQVATRPSSYFGRRVLSAKCTTLNGISFEQSTIRKDDVTDGLSQTIMIGEKYLGADYYGTGHVGADNENEYVGFDNDIFRTTGHAAEAGSLGPRRRNLPSAAHSPTPPTSCSATARRSRSTMRSIQNTFRMLGTRNEGTPVDMSKLGAF